MAKSIIGDGGESQSPVDHPGVRWRRIPILSTMNILRSLFHACMRPTRSGSHLPDPVLIYLGLSAVAVIVAALLLLLFTDPSPPAVAHLVFAVGIMPLIFAAITHFIPVLTRSGRAQRILLLAPLLLQLAGGVTFLAFSGETTAGALPQAATGTLLIALAFAG